jgi:DNA-binding CsgD family transcriptional regulator
MSGKTSALSKDLKERIISLSSNGAENYKIAQVLGIHRSTVGSVLIKREPLKVDSQD